MFSCLHCKLGLHCKLVCTNKHDLTVWRLSACIIQICKYYVFKSCCFFFFLAFSYLKTETGATHAHNLFREVKPDRSHVDIDVTIGTCRAMTTETNTNEDKSYKKTMFASCDNHRYLSLTHSLTQMSNSRGAHSWSIISLLDEARWCLPLHGGFEWQMWGLSMSLKCQCALLLQYLPVYTSCGTVSHCSLSTTPS